MHDFIFIFLEASLKGIVYLETNILSLFTHVVPHPYYLLASVEHKRRFFEENPCYSFQYNKGE